MRPLVEQCLVFVAVFIVVQARTLVSQEEEELIDYNTLHPHFHKPDISTFLENVYTRHSQEINELKNSSNSKLKCFVCKMLVGYLNTVGEQSNVQDYTVNRIINVCNLLKTYAPYICQNIIPMFKDEFFYVVNQLVLKPSEACGFLVGPSCGTYYYPFGNWTIDIPSTRKPTAVPTSSKGSSSIMKVLHLTDLHHDPQYVVGSNAACDQPLCCRAINGFPHDPKQKAGKWGDYRNCDLPISTLKNMLENINKSHHVDYIFWTGDFPSHGDWFQNKSTQLTSVQTLADFLHEYFPNVPVYSALGNHEANPVDSFPPPYVTGKYSTNWLYEKLNSTWTTWLDKDKVSKTIIKGAYYSTSPFPGYRIISLNMNYCNNMNWWLLTNMTDPADELTWLVEELLRAETLNENVHILGHIPPSECSRVWSYNYNRIVNRFKSIIPGTFFGHTHKDQLNIHYEGTSSQDKKATVVAYVAPSSTTYSFLNPAYRIYDFDGGNSTSRTWAVLDHHNYFLNLTEANLLDKPTWRLEYSAKAAYNMKSLSPEDWNRVVENFKTNRTAFNMYYRYEFHMSDASQQCDDKCHKEEICHIQQAVTDDSQFC